MGFLRSDELQIKVSANDTVLLEFYCNMFSDSITKLVVESDTHTSQIVRNENRSLVKIIELKLDQRLKLKAIKESPVYKIPNGQEKLVEDSVRLLHTVTTTDESSLDSSLKLNWGLIEAGIRNEVQKSTSRSKAIEAEVKRSVKITGDGQAVKVIWSELYRTGTAKIEINGRVSDIAFEYKEDFDLSLEVVD